MRIICDRCDRIITDIPGRGHVRIPLCDECQRLEGAFPAPDPKKEAAGAIAGVCFLLIGLLAFLGWVIGGGR